MNNKLTSIAFSIHSNKGVYALLLGSGISRTSGIPTGWDIVKDLIRKLAKVNQEECTPSEEDWFKTKYEEEPNYSTILSKLATTPAERLGLLKPYFENDDDSEEDQIKPTVAHKAIAKLVKKGYIKVIITTNFDRLTEQALQDEGIQPTVVKHYDDIEGATPLVHSPFTLVKVNGDYLDSRFLNTKEELDGYPQKMDEYITRIINEFGIISCGWSATWDTGLINSIRKSQNFRYSSYWTYIGRCESELNALASFRRGNTLEIKDADTFFSEINERVEALESINDNHPLTADIAVARLKKYIAREDGRILAHDLLYNEREIAIKQIAKTSNTKLEPYAKYIIPLLESFDGIINTMLNLVIQSTYWCKEEHEDMLVETIKKFANQNFDKNNYYKTTNRLHYYPSLILLYALGVVAIKKENYRLLQKVFTIIIEDNIEMTSNKIYLISEINSHLIEKEEAKKAINMSLSKHTRNKLEPYTKSIFTNQSEYEETVDLFEYILALHYHFLNCNFYERWIPYGNLKSTNHWRRPNLLEEFKKKADTEKENWAPLKSGMFNKNYQTYNEIKEKVDIILNDFPLYAH